MQENNRSELKSIMFVITSLSYGGAQIQVRDLAIAHKRRGTQVSIVSLMQPEEHVDALKKHGIEVLDLGMSPRLPNILLILKFKSFVKKINPDVVNAHMVHAILFTRIARLLGVKINVLVSSAHNVIDSGYILQALYRLTDRWTDTTTNVCQQAVDNFVDLRLANKSRIQVMHNGISAKPLPKNNRDKKRKDLLRLLNCSESFLWLSVGSMDNDQKNYELLIETFSKHSNPDSRLLIAGTGKQYEILLKQIQTSGAGDKIYLLGTREDIRELMLAVDAFILPSKWEGLPIVLLEASIAQLPIVCTDVGGNTDIVKNNSGIIVKSDDQEQLAAAIKKLENLSDQQRKLLGSNGFQYVTEYFELEKIVTKWSDLYLHLMKSR